MFTFTQLDWFNELKTTITTPYQPDQISRSVWSAQVLLRFVMMRALIHLKKTSWPHNKAQEALRTPNALRSLAGSLEKGIVI